MTDTLDDFITKGVIDPKIANKMLEEFDRAFAATISEGIRDTDAKIKGNLKQYRFLDDVWIFHLRDVTITLNEGWGEEKKKLYTDKLKIIAMNTKKA